MKKLLALYLVLGATTTLSQEIKIQGTLAADDISQKLGQLTIYSLPDSSLKKGTYLDSSYFSLVMDTDGITDLYAKFSLDGYSDTLITFTVEDTLVDLGLVVMSKSIELETFEFVYREPMYERTMDGIEVNVGGTTLETLDNLFEILKASPKLNSPDDETIEIIGKGSPLILVDRQPILTSDELKAIPADMVERIEIITNPSAKYRTQGRGSGVIEVYTRNFRLQGYNMNINAQGGMNTQLKPTGRLGVGYSYKKQKLTLNAYANANYSSQVGVGITENVIDAADLQQTTNSDFENEGWNIWQHFSLKSAYQINDRQKLAAGVRGGGSIRNSDNISDMTYSENGVIQTISNQHSVSGNTWLNNSAFMNYTWDTDTNKSIFEVNLNYQLKVNEGNSTYNSLYENVGTGTISNFDIRNVNRNRPNIGELRISYEHVFDTTGWKLSGGGAYSIIFNGMRFDQFNSVDGEWVVDDSYSNSYDYFEQIGSVFTEVTKNWKKISVRAGLTGEFTDLDGYSNSLSKQFMDSSYVLIFPSGSIMIKPVEKVSMTLRYNSGISRPQFSNYDPFVRIEDSLGISYGNPNLRPAVRQSIGFDLDLFYSYGLSVDYSVVNDPASVLNFIDTNFLANSTPWNADQKQTISVSITAPLKTKWMQGWLSFWYDYSVMRFTPVFEREDFNYSNYGMWSYLNFFLPKDFTLTNRLHVMRWGTEDRLSTLRASWGMKLTRKFLNNDLRLFAEVNDIIPPKNIFKQYGSNYETYSESQYQFTSFRLGLYYKFGRLKREIQIKESESGQSGRI